VAGIVTIGYLAFLFLSKVGISSHKDMTSEVTYKTYENMEKALDINVDAFPIDFITQRVEESSTVYKVINNQIAEVYNTNGNTLARAIGLIDIKYDVLNLSDEALADNIYSVSDNIVYLRVRTGYPKMEHCTIINYSTPETNYGLIVDESLGLEDICNVLSISVESLSNFDNSTYNISEGSYTEYKIDNFIIELPTVASNIELREFVGFSSIFIDETPVINFLYSTESIESDANNEWTPIMVNDNLRIDYLHDNPFDVNSQAYIDFENLINTIDNSIKTIKYE
jgi:hypothetical protein